MTVERIDGTPQVSGTARIRSRRLDALQGVRGIAALLVVVAHSVENFNEVEGETTRSFLADACGILGVNTFFVISGFLMIYVHGDEFGQSKAPRNYYSRRMARILPLYWAFTLVYAIRYILSDDATWLDVMRSFLFVPYRDDAGLWQPVLHQGWTLNYEMLFYLFFGLSLFFARGVWMVFTIFAALVLSHAVFGYTDSLGPLFFWSEPIILYFLAGLVLGLLRRRVNWGLSFAAAGASSMVVLFVFVLSVAKFHTAPHFFAFALPITSIMIVSLVALAREDADRAWPRRFADLLGNISYSVYLSHLLVIAPAAKIILGRLFPDMPLPVFLVLMLCATAIFGYLVYKLVEKPLIKLWNRAFVRSPKSVTTTPAAA
jgi:peptidoglycan/LPS O-acetylase OafA/YrhL